MGKQRQTNYGKEMIDNLCKENRQFQEEKKKQINYWKEEKEKSGERRDSRDKSWERRIG